MVRTRAFSLLELLIVLAVMAGVAALVFPSLARPLAEIDVQRAAALLRDEISQCRNEAVLGHHMLLVKLTAGQEEVQWGTWQSLMAQSNGLQEDPDQLGMLKTHRLPSGIVIESVSWPTQITAPNAESLDADSDEQSFQDDLSSTLSSIAGESSAEVWYLPYLPTGRCRDCQIILRDTSSDARCGLEIDGVLQMMRFQRLPSMAPNETQQLGRINSSKSANGANQ